MNRTKETFILGFAVFAAFFGAGNLILPPMLGFNSGADWWKVSAGFLLSSTVIPLLALLGHAKLQGTMMDFGRKVSNRFALIFSVCIYVMIIILPCPRTAAVTYEIAIRPYFYSSPLLTSFIYFTLVFFLAINRSTVMDFLGKYLTPVIGIILLAIIILGIVGPATTFATGSYDSPLIGGFLEGYQTYDAIAGLVMGGVVVITVCHGKNNMSTKEKQTMIGRSGFIAMLGLSVIYIGLIYTGAKFSSNFEPGIGRTGLLSGLSSHIMGRAGTAFLSVLVALACFTTAVSIVIGVADFFKGLFKNSKRVYLITTAISCIAGVLFGQFEVKFIIDLAVYVLMFLYPLSIVLIMLNILPEKYTHQWVFRIVVGLALLFSIPDLLKFLIPEENLEYIYDFIPFSRDGLGWVIPALAGFLIANLIPWNKKKSTAVS